VIFVVSLAMRMTGGAGAGHPMLPGFVLAFTGLVVINSAGLIPAALQEASSERQEQESHMPRKA
jgi:uncharacterized membrane protein YadS